MKKICVFLLLAALALSLAACGSGRELPLKSGDIRKLLTLEKMKEKYGEPDEINGFQWVFYNVTWGGLEGTLYVTHNPDDDGKDLGEIAVGYIAWGYADKNATREMLDESPELQSVIEKMDSYYGPHAFTDDETTYLDWRDAAGSPSLDIELVFEDDGLWMQIFIGD